MLTDPWWRKLARGTWKAIVILLATFGVWAVIYLAALGAICKLTH